MQYVSPTSWDLNGTPLMLDICHALLYQHPILLTKINATHENMYTILFKLTHKL
jgi:hypothetical protein